MCKFVSKMLSGKVVNLFKENNKDTNRKVAVDVKEVFLLRLPSRSLLQRLIGNTFEKSFKKNLVRVHFPVIYKLNCCCFSRSYIIKYNRRRVQDITVFVKALCKIQQLFDVFYVEVK